MGGRGGQYFAAPLEVPSALFEAQTRREPGYGAGITVGGCDFGGAVFDSDFGRNLTSRGDVDGEFRSLISRKHLFVQFLDCRSSLGLAAGLIDVAGVGGPEGSRCLGITLVEGRD